MRDARSSLEAQRRVAEATSEWLSQKRHESFLFSGLRLAESLDWAEAHPDDLSTMEREFLEESRKRYAQERRLSDAATLDQLEASAPKIWDVEEEKRKWLARATTLTAGISEHQKHLERIRKSASVQDKALDLPQWEFESDDVRYSHDTLMLLIERLTRFSRGLMNAAEHSLRVSASLRSLTIESHADEWKTAIESISNLSECPIYGGLQLRPQLGLIPLWRDSDSGLWEFAHLPTGQCAQRDESVVKVGDDTGVVLILIPGGSFRMGSRPPTLEAQLGAPNVDPYCRAEEETPVHQVQLDPFFVSKFQLTQGQFMRAMGGNVSYHRPGDPSRGIILAHPVECISWEECQQALGRTGLTLPTEAQWEYAARGGTSSIWWSGNDAASLSGKVNLLGCRESVYPYPHPAPVGWFRFPNPFGLEDVIGNVWEWCKDWFGSYLDPVCKCTGERLPETKAAKVCRGGSFFNTADFGRSAVRYFRAPVDARFNNLGVRAAREIEAEP
jgi:formylglycine-generating enzyme required for sulfatase activity